MSYEGWYEKAAIPTLVACLKAAYESRKFRGGRGINVQSDFLYRNHPQGLGFSAFNGMEFIAQLSTSAVFGTHAYRGGMLI
jgi:hypothetical protein